MADRRALGRSGLLVRAVGFGGMPLSIRPERPSEADAVKVLHAAFEAGTDFVDTADVYCLDDSDLGHNERLIAKAVKSWPGKVVVATKGGLTRPGGRWESDAKPESLRRACERSLKALGVEAIDLYQLHAPDDAVPLADSVGAMRRLQEEGKVRFLGLSNVDLAELDLALTVARVESVQNRLNPDARCDLDNGLVAGCAKRGVAYLPYCPVGGGRNQHAELTARPAIRALAEKHRTSPYCVVLAWLLAQGAHVIPIPGASKPASATDSPKALSVRLSPEDLAAVAAAGKR